jgi:hypothetical protein
MNFFKKIYNTPFKKCIITNQFYPMSLMIRIVNLFPVTDKNTKAIFLPDSLYCIVKNSFKFFLFIQKKPGKYFICNKAIFEKMNKDKSFKKKNNLGDNFMSIVLDDLKYSNNAVLKNLIFENKIYFAFFDQQGKIQRIAIEKGFLNVIKSKENDETQ